MLLNVLFGFVFPQNLNEISERKGQAVYHEEETGGGNLLRWGSIWAAPDMGEPSESASLARMFTLAGSRQKRLHWRGCSHTQEAVRISFTGSMAVTAAEA